MSDVVRWTTEAYNKIQTMHENWNFLHNQFTFELQAGLSTYNPSLIVGSNNGVGVRTPTKDTFIIQQTNTNKEKTRLRYVPWSVWQIDEKRLNVDEVRQPTMYTEDPSGVYHFYPSEQAQINPLDNINHTITFQGYARPHVMTVNNDIPAIPEQYQELIKMEALIRYAEFYNSPEVYKSAALMFQEGIKKMEYSELPRENLRTPTLVHFA